MSKETLNIAQREEFRVDSVRPVLGDDGKVEEYWDDYYLRNSERDFETEGAKVAKLQLMKRAEVKMWNPDKHFGFVKLEDGRELFVHATAFFGGERPGTYEEQQRQEALVLKKGGVVRYSDDDVGPDPRDPRRTRLAIAVEGNEYLSVLKKATNTLAEAEVRFRNQTEQKQWIGQHAEEIFGSLESSLPICLPFDSSNSNNTFAEMKGAEVRLGGDEIEILGADKDSGLHLRERQTVTIVKGAVSLSRYYEVETSGWFEVKLGYIESEQEPGTVEVPLRTQRNSQIAKISNPEQGKVAYAGRAEEPYIDNDRVVQVIKAETPLGQIEKVLTLYKNQRDQRNEAPFGKQWGEWDIGELKERIDKMAMEKELEAKYRELLGKEVTSAESALDLMIEVSAGYGWDWAVNKLNFLKHIYRPDSVLETNMYARTFEVFYPESTDGYIRGGSYYNNVDYTAFYLKDVSGKKIAAIEKPTAELEESLKMMINGRENVPEGYYHYREIAMVAADREIIALAMQKEFNEKLEEFIHRDANPTAVSTVIGKRLKEWFGSYQEMVKPEVLVTGREQLLTQAKMVYNELKKKGEELEKERIKPIVGSEEEKMLEWVSQNRLNIGGNKFLWQVDTITEEEWKNLWKQIEQLQTREGNGKTILENRLEAVDKVSNGYKKQREIGWRYNVELQPQRGTGSWGYYVDLVDRQGKVMVPDKDIYNDRKEPRTRVYKEVSPETAEVKVTIHNPGGSLSSDPMSNVLIEIENAGKSVGKEQFEGIWRYLESCLNDRVYKGDGSSDDSTDWKGNYLLADLGLHSPTAIRSVFGRTVMMFNEGVNSKLELRIEKTRSQTDPKIKYQIYKK